MASSFRRNRKNKGAEILSLPGTKPWTGGITLTSTGLRDLDAILGGAGQPLGTIIWLDEDRWTRSLATCLVQYWCAEALSQEQCLLLPALETNDATSGELDEGHDDDDDLNFEIKSSHQQLQRLLESLPRNLHFDKYDQASKNSGDNDVQDATLETLAEEEEGDGEANEEGLKIAWQYRKDVQRERLGGDSVVTATTTKVGKGNKNKKEYCHSYDLGGLLMDQVPVMEKSTILEYSLDRKDIQHQKSGIRWFRTIKSRIDAILKERKQVIRILFYQTQHLTPLSIAFPLLISYVRQHQLPVVVMVSIQPWAHTDNNGANSTKLTALRRLCDVVLEAEGFASRAEYPQPSEFRMFQGLLQIRKVSTMTAATANQGGGHFADLTNNRQLAADLHGLKRDRRKLHIQMLHIPPEDYAESGGSVGGGAVRSGAGRPKTTKKSSSGGLECASSGGALDF
mmetsp:Transcript_9329/g.22810  ORF Transcript_9329/g.22810 Transcript_9329/m.22810 type:complete len:454 (-) Transcript_9329:2149-3510(-)